MPTWPSSLPQYLLKRGYEESFPPLSVQTEMDAPVPKTRRRFSAVMIPVKGLQVLSDDQLETLMNFFVNDCAGGSLSFAWTMQRYFTDPDSTSDTDTTTDVDSAPTDFPAANYLWDLKNPPVAKDVGGSYEVSISLFMLP
jgi:hypothetical protein